jgi:hypothetical protein
MPLNGIASTVDKQALFQKAEFVGKKSVVDCAFMAFQANGKEIQTIEG